MIGAVAILALAAVIGIILRAQAPPTEAARTAQQFVAAWNRHDFRRAYSFLNTPIAEDIFVGAVTQSAIPVSDLQIEGMSRQDQRRVVVSYSGVAPEGAYAVAGVVVANRFRYPAACGEENARQARTRRVADVLDLEQNAAGVWQIGLRGESDFLQRGASLIALSFDLSPRFIWGHITADADPKAASYDDLVIFDALNVLRNDLQPVSTDQLAVPATTSIHDEIANLARTCVS